MSNSAETTKVMEYTREEFRQSGREGGVHGSRGSGLVGTQFFFLVRLLRATTVSRCLATPACFPQVCRRLQLNSAMCLIYTAVRVGGLFKRGLTLFLLFAYHQVPPLTSLHRARRKRRPSVKSPHAVICRVSLLPSVRRK